MDGPVDNRLGEFLRARRGQISPVTAGFVDRGVRRVPGLRREEMAILAGVSVAYYTRLEQGRDRHPSAAVLDALATALALDGDSRRHLHALAEPAPPSARRLRGRPERARPRVAHLLGAHVDVPALVIGRGLDVLASNLMARALHPSYRPGVNLALEIFLNPEAQLRYADVASVQRDRVASLREAAGTFPGDPRVVEVVGELSIESETFRRLWGLHAVHAKREGTKRFRHPAVGDLELEYSFFATPGGEDGQHVLMYFPQPHSVHAQSLSLLGSLAAGDPIDATQAPAPEPARDPQRSEHGSTSP